MKAADGVEADGARVDLEAVERVVDDKTSELLLLLRPQEPVPSMVLSTQLAGTLAHVLVVPVPDGLGAGTWTRWAMRA